MVSAAIANAINWLNATFTPQQIYVIGAFLIWVPYYWAVSLFFLYLDYFKPAWAQPYRLQPDRKFNFEQFKSAVPLILLNTVVAGVIQKLFIIPTQIAKPGFFDPTLFSLFDFLKWVIGAYVVEDVIFYLTHRLCHENRWLYQNVHKIHHEWQTPCAAIATYAHPLEHAFVNVLPATLGLCLFSNHFVFDMAWYFAACTNTLITHCGYHFPGSIVFPERHDFHHERFTENYGVGMMDMIFGPSFFFKKSIHLVTDTFYITPSWFKNTRNMWIENKRKNKKQK